MTREEPRSLNMDHIDAAVQSRTKRKLSFQKANYRMILLALLGLGLFKALQIQPQEAAVKME